MDNSFVVAVKLQQERAALIEALTAAAIKTVDNWEVYESKPAVLPVISIPIEYPIYRMANGRTQTEQLAYIAEKGLSADWFDIGEENDSAQRVQHSILKRFANDGTDSIKPIIGELERTGQTEPILITRTGVVVNGNRRLAAMRELFAEPANGHSGFATIECAVLPVLTPAQIDDIEVRLQMRPETKLPYGWVNDALKVKKQLASKGKEDLVARLMNRDRTDVKKTVQALSLADIYLKDWRKAPYDYRLVADGRQFFPDLVSKLKNKEGPLLEANMRIAWMLFDNRSSLGSRIYEFNKVLGEKATEVLESLSGRIELDEPEEDQEEDDFEIDLGPQTSASEYGSLIQALDDEERREEVFEELRAVCQTIIDAGKANKSGNSALVAARDANTRLTEIDLTKADPKTFGGLDKQLEQVILRAESLRSKLADILSSAGSSST